MSKRITAEDRAELRDVAIRANGNVVIGSLTLIRLLDTLEAAERERDELADAHRSLLTELWDGVRAHELKVPSKGRDGERLIHAYCGGIAKIRNERDDLRAKLESATALTTDLLK